MNTTRSLATWLATNDKRRGGPSWGRPVVFLAIAKVVREGFEPPKAYTS